MLFFKDNIDGYYQFNDNAPPEWYAHLTPTAQQFPPQPAIQEVREVMPPLSPWQLRKSLKSAGLRGQVEAAINSSQNEDLKDWWKYETDFYRIAPLLLLMAQQLNITDEQLDQIFITGAAL